MSNETQTAPEAPSPGNNEQQKIIATTSVAPPIPVPANHDVYIDPKKVYLRHPRTGEVKPVKIGWSWVLFLFSPVFGLPLFLRRLYIWGGVMLVIWVVNLFLPFVGLPIMLGMEIWFGIKGNEMTAKNYLEHGWQWMNPDSDAVKRAKLLWRLS